MTLAEYQLRMEAYSLQQIKIQERLHLQAFLNKTVQATKGSKKHPKPYYEKFEQFFDAQKWSIKLDRLMNLTIFQVLKRN